MGETCTRRAEPVDKSVLLELREPVDGNSDLRDTVGNLVRVGKDTLVKAIQAVHGRYSVRLGFAVSAPGLYPADQGADDS